MKLLPVAVAATAGTIASGVFTVVALGHLLRVLPKWIGDFFLGAYSLAFLGRAVAETAYKACYREFLAGRLAERHLQLARRCYDAWAVRHEQYVRMMQRLHAWAYRKQAPQV